jgi:hypothetical protein
MWLAVKGDDHIAFPQARQLCGAAFPLHPFLFCIKSYNLII